MKVVQVIPHLASGGAERFVVDLSNELLRNGQNVTILTFYDLEGKYGFYKKEIDKGIKLISLHKSVGFSIKCLLQTFEIIKKEKPDIIHSHINSLQYTILPQLFLAHGVHTVHNEAQQEVHNKFEVALRKQVFKYNLVQPVTISPQSHDSFVKFYRTEVPLINNGRAIIGDIIVSEDVRNEINSFRKTQNTKIIVQLARFQRQKNIPMMARVASRLYEVGYDFALLCIGTTENKEIENEVRKQMPPCGHILGERINPLEYLKEADAFALSSSFEGMPISLLEALAEGAVPVCTPVGGIPDVVKDGDNGFLSVDNTEASYYNAMKRFLDSDRSALKIMAQKAKDSFAPYSMSVCANQYLQLYKSLIDSK